MGRGKEGDGLVAVDACARHLDVRLGSEDGHERTAHDGVVIYHENLHRSSRGIDANSVNEVPSHETRMVPPRPSTRSSRDEMPMPLSES